ncbi:TPA: hypothetical protein EYO57_31780 [Candidatus Poribacteria bacterium]|nr:hypothetical protein [Candidatus Poribacteria bacterium]
MLNVAGLSPAKSLDLRSFITRSARLLLGLGRGCSVTFVLVGRFLGTGRFRGTGRFLGCDRGFLGTGRFLGCVRGFLGTGRFLGNFLGRSRGVGVGIPPRMRNIGVFGIGRGGVLGRGWDSYVDASDLRLGTGETSGGG